MNRSFSPAVFWVLLFLGFSHVTVAQTIEVRTLRFATNSFNIDEKYLATLDSIGKKCTSDTFMFLKIFAYADKKGTKKRNEELSEKRAIAVCDYLMGKFSIDTTKIYTTWLGEETDGAYDLHFPSANVQQRAVDVLVFFRGK